MNVQEDGAEFPADGFAAPAALPAATESWDDKYATAPPSFDAAPVAGQWSEAAAPGFCGEADGALGLIALAVSDDGVNWRRGTGVVETMSSGGAATDGSDCGIVLPLSQDWWTFDTAAVGAPDVQVLSSGAVASGVGVYWMFYTGADFGAVPPPTAAPGGVAAPGRRTLPGLALSQDGCVVA